MKRLFAIAALLMALWPPLAKADPQLYVYRGAGCSGVAALPMFEGMLGRKVDGVVDFNDFSQGTANALSTLNWQLGCWQGKGYKLAISIPLGFRTGPSTAAIATGAGDDYYRQVGARLVSHGFANADIRLGWEGNGGWYPWGRQSAFAAAFARAYGILKATPGAHFTVVYNPAGGIDAGAGFPGVGNLDGMAWDIYASSWTSAGAKTEPDLWKGSLMAPWGVASVGRVVPGHGFHGDLSQAVPEFGVGSRNDGHGACTKSGLSDCDDPYYMANALDYFRKANVRYIGYWDYNAGDYNSQLSNGSRPQEAGVFIREFGSAGIKAILKSHTVAYTAAPAPALTVTGCHAVAIQTGPSAWDVIVWAIQAHPSATLAWAGGGLKAKLYDPLKGTSAVRSLGAVNAATFALAPAQPLIVAIGDDR